ncbi:MAG TPA: DUF2460 domain-containing protein [Alphaproteobacteria bacterium]|nr:DUF2460 domain-containing protein [Alphaproteobacteria bacterium]
MSNDVFPELPGLAWSVVRRPTFSTIVQRAASGREVRAALQSFPIWEWQLAYDVLRDDAAGDLRTLMGFFLRRQGAFDSFLFRDPSDHEVTDQPIGVGGNGATTFQLVRTLGGFVEPIFDLGAPPNIKVSGVPRLPDVDFTVTNDARIVFATPPAAGAAITATFAYLFRVRFKEDIAEFNNFAFRLWELEQLELVGVKP